MSFQQIGFLDTSLFTATYLTRHRDKVEAGVLRLRDFADDKDEIVDLPLVKDWKNAKSILSRLRNGAAPFFQGQTPGLGRAWLEVLPPLSGTPWSADGGDYGDAHIRARVCLVPSPGAVSYAGGAQAALQVGAVVAYDPRLLSSEVNFGEHARVHLVVDVRRPDADPGA
jgi:hypothetical protein